MTIVIDPNPAIEGQDVTITVDGPGPYYWRNGRGEWEELDVDAEERDATITVPAGMGGGVLAVSDLCLPDADTADAPINSTD